MRTVARWSVALKAHVKSRGNFGHFHSPSELHFAIVFLGHRYPYIGSQKTEITGELHPAQRTGDSATDVLAEE